MSRYRQVRASSLSPFALVTDVLGHFFPTLFVSFIFMLPFGLIASLLCAVFHFKSILYSVRV